MGYYLINAIITGYITSHTSFSQPFRTTSFIGWFSVFAQRELQAIGMCYYLDRSKEEGISVTDFIYLCDLIAVINTMFILIRTLLRPNLEIYLLYWRRKNFLCDG